jgi:hypothetical protein
MIGMSLVVKSYIVVNDGCPLSIMDEGPDHVMLRCGGSTGESFEIVIQHNALRELVKLGEDKLADIDAPGENIRPDGLRGSLSSVRHTPTTNEVKPAS